MTDHALQRIRERAPHLDPEAALRSISEAAREAEPWGETATGERILRHAIGSTLLYALVKRDGAVATVLAPGMDVETPTGRVVLPEAVRHLNLSAGVHAVGGGDYHADRLRETPTLSSTLARTILNQSPRHAWTAHPRLNPDYAPKNSKTFDFGRAAHRAVLGAGGDYAVAPEDVLASDGSLSTKAAKAWLAEQREAGVTPITQDNADKLDAMMEVMKAALWDLGLVLDPACSELTALAPVEDVWCRAMIDNAPAKPFKGKRLLIDFKTTEDASPDACIRSVENYGYDAQAAFYLDAWAAATGEARTFLFAFQEKSPPYEVGFVRLHDAPGEETDWLEDARSKVAYARRQWAHCLAVDDWPGYPRQIGIVGARSFHRAKWAAQGANDWTEAPKPTPDTLRASYAAQAPERTA